MKPASTLNAHQLINQNHTIVGRPQKPPTIVARNFVHDANSSAFATITRIHDCVKLA